MMLFVTLCVTFVGFVNMTKMVCLSLAKKEKQSNLATVWDIVIILNVDCTKLYIKTVMFYVVIESPA